MGGCVCVIRRGSGEGGRERETGNQRRCKIIRKKKSRGGRGRGREKKQGEAEEKLSKKKGGDEKEGR